jgi:DNA-binding beta-propeller fold protein YncE
MSVSVNAADGSCWVASPAMVIHVAADGTVLAEVSGFHYFVAVAADPTDGSCWVADNDGREQVSAVVHLAGDGAELWREDRVFSPNGLAVDPTDGSCWVACNTEVIHFAADGTELLRKGGFTYLRGIAVNSTDGSCWVTDENADSIVHLAHDGTELWRGGGFGYPQGISINSGDGSCWVALWRDKQVVHLAADGTELWRGGQFEGLSSVSVDPADGSCWVAGETQLVHIAMNGSELPAPAVSYVRSVSVNPTDGSCWVGTAHLVLHLAADGSELWRGESFSWPDPVSVNPTDGSCWAHFNGVDADYSVHSEAVHLAPDGSELLRVTDVWLGSGSVDPTDSSIWVTSGDHRAVIHLAEDATELVRAEGFCCPNVAANPADGSCWVADCLHSQVVHLADDGTELVRVGGLTYPSAISVNPTDGSCWAAELSEDAAVVGHFAEDGSLLWKGGNFRTIYNLSVNPTDGSCWVDDVKVGLVHLAQNGTVLHGPFRETLYPWSVSVNPVDGSCWVAGDGGVAHLRSDGVELWRTQEFQGRGISVDPADGSCWVGDAGRGQVAHLVPVPEHGAVFSASYPRLASLWSGPLPVAFYDLSLDNPSSWLWDFGEGTTSTQQNAVHTYTTAGRFHVSLTVVTDLGTDTETKEDYVTLLFKDVTERHWAFEQVMACVDGGIVKGYSDGTYQPEGSVTRDQMAVYISRALAGGDASIPNGPATPSFSDVPSNHWAYKHIEYAVSQNVVKGYTDGTYLPSVAVDRGTMAVYIARAMVAPGGDAAIPDPVPPATFSDVATTFWAYKQVEYCVGQGVVKGYDDGLYHPERVVTRDQMAVYIARAFGLL